MACFVAEEPQTVAITPHTATAYPCRINLLRNFPQKHG
jgi:hypothetical protein